METKNIKTEEKAEKKAEENMAEENDLKVEKETKEEKKRRKAEKKEWFQKEEPYSTIAREIPQDPKESKESNDSESLLKKDTERFSQKNNSQNIEIESEKIHKKLQEYTLVIQRQQAEFENYKKRVKRDQIDFETHANQKFIEELLPIVDNLEKAIDSSTGTKENYIALKEGIELIQKQLEQFLVNKGVRRIEALGKEFDPNFHEALQIDTSKKDYTVDTVIEEWQKGYCLYDRVIRPAKVLVAKANVDFDSKEKGQ